MRTLLLSLAILALVLSCHAGDTGLGWNDDEILAQVLRSQRDLGGYTVVDPKTSLGDTLTGKTPAEIDKTREYVQREFAGMGYDIGPLFDMLIEKNKNQAYITLESSPEDGYLIDYERKFEKYFEKDGGGWKAWYRDNPFAHGYVRVSLPAFDAETGLVLVYIETQRHELAGFGYLVACRLANGHLAEIGRYLLWVL